MTQPAPSFVPAPVSSIPPAVPPAVTTPTAPTEPPSNTVLPPVVPPPVIPPPVLPPSTIDAAGNLFGDYIGTFDQSDIQNAAIERSGIISITYNASGIFSDYPTVGCGNRQPITPERVELGFVQWTELIDFGAETCANGNVTIAEGQDGNSWEYVVSVMSDLSFLEC
jgi:hypothetical protein